MGVHAPTGGRFARGSTHRNPEESQRLAVNRGSSLLDRHVARREIVIGLFVCLFVFLVEMAS